MRCYNFSREKKKKDILVCSSGLQNAAEYAFPNQPAFVSLVPKILPSFFYQTSSKIWYLVHEGPTCQTSPLHGHELAIILVNEIQ